MMVAGTVGMELGSQGTIPSREGKLYMGERRRDLLTIQHDLFQRYALLADVVENISGGQGADVKSLLDIGCGPGRLVEAFLGSQIAVTRADVDQFGDAEIVLVRPENPLPFADRSFDLVTAMDVVEHIPSDRRSFFLSECQRVARRGVILSCPIADSGAIEAETRFQAAVRRLTGKEEAFLTEHAAFGLPSSAAIEAVFEGAGWHLLTMDNNPIDHWLLFNLIDYIYAYDLGGGDQKGAFNIAVNSTVRPFVKDAKHYRRIFVGLREAGSMARVQALFQAIRSAAPTVADSQSVSTLVEILPVFFSDVQAPLRAAMKMKDEHMGMLHSSNEEMRRLLATKEAELSDPLLPIISLGRLIARAFGASVSMVTRAWHRLSTRGC